MDDAQAYVDGQNAAAAGEPVSNNPHSAWNGRLFDAWNLGWIDQRKPAPVVSMCRAIRRELPAA